jgi:NAD(P)-dependent dehydrogenase (short-subunit alcohol dehydrogenase family)
MTNIREATSFGAASTTDDVLSGVNPKGKRILIMGVSTGLGGETARSLVRKTGLALAVTSRRCPFRLGQLHSSGSPGKAGLTAFAANAPSLARTQLRERLVLRPPSLKKA